MNNQSDLSQAEDMAAMDSSISNPIYPSTTVQPPVDTTIPDVLPGEFAARVYSQLLPQFNMQVQTLGKRGLFKVLNSLVKIPLMSYNPVMDKVEKNVYALADRLLQAKFVMVSEVMAEEYTKMENERKDKEKENEYVA